MTLLLDLLPLFDATAPFEILVSVETRETEQQVTRVDFVQEVSLEVVNQDDEFLEIIRLIEPDLIEVKEHLKQVTLVIDIEVSTLAQSVVAIDRLTIKADTLGLAQILSIEVVDEVDITHEFSTLKPRTTIEFLQVLDKVVPRPIVEVPIPQDGD